MKIVRLENGQNEQFALEIPLQEEYIKVKKYKPYGQPVDKKTITTITEDMYIEWEISEYYNNIQELLQSTQKHKNSIQALTQSICDCCKYGIYTEQDILNYQKFIEQQDNDDEIELNKKYYDNRFIDKMDKDFTSPVFIEYNTNNYQNILWKDKNFLSWIEIHSKTKPTSLYICFNSNFHKVLLEKFQLTRRNSDIEFILNTDNKYIILESCRIFAALSFNNKRNIQEIFRMCLVLLEIIKAFGLKPDEYNIDNFFTKKDNFYSICPKDNDKRVSIRCIKQYGDVADRDVEHKNIFALYKLNFEQCNFQDDVIAENLFSMQICFQNCIFMKKVIFKNVTFTGEAIFRESIFEDDVDFKYSKFLKNRNKENKTDFSKSIFKKAAQFYCAIFEQQTLFLQTIFSDQAFFHRVIFSNKIDFSSAYFKSGAFFTDGIFKQDTLFLGVRFHGEANFYHVKFQAGVACQGITDFSLAYFQENAELSSSFYQKTVFYKTFFNNNAHFWNAKFIDKTFFREAQFKKDAFFSNVIFGEVNFSQSKFYQNAYFDGSIFQKFPNFIHTIFNGDVNFTNTELNVKFEEAKKQIEALYIEKKTKYNNQAEEDREGKEEPKEYKITNEFRDSFRTIKSTLIKDNNMLDASNYHRAELYCKELELEYRRKEKVKKSEIRDIVDRIQLYCYRLTSDHHTNLLMILNNVIFLIALFGVANLMLIPFDKTYTISFFKINVIETIVCLIFMGTAICFMFDSWKIFMLKPIYLLLIFLFLALVFLFSPVLVLVMLSIYSAILLSAVLLLLLFSYFLIKIQKILDLKQCIFILSYLITAFMLFSNPSSILPILGKLIENKSGEMCLFVVGNVKILCCGSNSFASETLNLIYMLFLFLLLWSLQKTVRKNTIVPS